MRRLILSLALVATPAMTAAPFQDTVLLDRAVASFTGRAIGEDGGARSPVDTRLKLAACPMVSLTWHGTTHDSVVVTCTGPEWHVYVPVRVTATAPAAAAPASTQVVARAAPVIRRGDPVMISAGSGGFSITRDGIAMGDAAPGGRFMVKVDNTRSPVQAVAIDSGRATLPGWME